MLITRPWLSRTELLKFKRREIGLNQVAVAVGNGAVSATQIWRELRHPRKWIENLLVAV